MASDDTGDWGQPNFLASGAPDLDGDPNDVSDYFAYHAPRRFATQAALISAGAPPANGYMARVDAIPGALFVRVSSAWVMYGTPKFADATARNAAITTPAAGMKSALATEFWDREYDGSAWKLPRGKTLLQTKTFTTSSALSFDALAGVTEFDYIEFVLNVTARSAAAKLGLRLRAAGVDASGSVYDEYANGAAATSSQWANAATALAHPCTIQGTLYDLGKASPTRVIGQSTGAAVADGTGINYSTLAGQYRTSTAFDSFSFIPASGTATAVGSAWGVRA